MWALCVNMGGMCGVESVISGTVRDNTREGCYGINGLYSRYMEWWGGQGVGLSPCMYRVGLAEGVVGVEGWSSSEVGGVLGLEKGTNCGPTNAERWLSRHEMAKKGGLSSYYNIVR